MNERRVHQPPTDTEGYLQQLPSLTLLNRLPIAMLGVAHDGQMAYANPAFAELLGYIDADAVTCIELPKLLAGCEELTPTDCVIALRTTAEVVEWNHSQGYPLRTRLSKPLLLRKTDTLFLIGIVDVTAELWESKRH